MPADRQIPLESETDLLVLEYLAHSGYDRAVGQLKIELRERREGKVANWRPIGKEMQDKVKDKMLRALDRGDREEVLRLWDNFVPPLVRRSACSSTAQNSASVMLPSQRLALT